jgi:hypothetical protein
MLGFAPDHAGTAPTVAAAQQDPAEGEQNARNSEDDRLNKTANKMKFRPLTSDEIQNGDDTHVRRHRDGIAAALLQRLRDAT